EKKIVPEPFHPRRQSSSPKWAKYEATRAWRPTLHRPTSSRERAASQSRGQTRQASSIASARSTRRSSSSRGSTRYAGHVIGRGKQGRGGGRAGTAGWAGRR